MMGWLVSMMARASSFFSKEPSPSLEEAAIPPPPGPIANPVVPAIAPVQAKLAIVVPPDFNKNNILSDGSFIFKPGAQAFLEAKGSCLASYEVEGMRAGDFIDSVCSPLGAPWEFVATRLECEQGLISMKKLPGKMVLDRCLGFGMTDSGDMPRYYGFSNQVRCAVTRIAKLYHESANKQGRPFVVDRDKDGTFELVIPQTCFTYALYVYTPWVGDKPHITAGGYKVGWDGYSYGALDTWKYTKKNFPYMLAA